MTGITRRCVALLVGMLLTATACSSTDSTDSTASDDATTTTESAVVETESSTTTTAAPESPTTTVAAALPEVMFESARCEFTEPADVKVECGWVEVPQHWDDPTDPDTIRLHVATFTTPETPDDATPVMYLEGGPGGDTFGLIDFAFAEQWAPFADEHPFVMFTQRGSALSEVDLVCEELVDLTVQQLEQTPDLDAENDAYGETLASCMNRLEDEGADIDAYHSVASANDVDAIRRALGYDQWNVLGISYGTRLGQEVVRNHPDGVRALLLDSVQPTDPAFGSLASLPQTFDGALDRLYEGCAADADCAALAPNLEERLRAVVDQADATPFEVEAVDQLSLDAYDTIVDGDRLLGAIFQALYVPEAFAAIPEMVNQLEAGDTTTLATLVGLQITNAPFISNGMYAAVMCHDFLAELTDESDIADGLSGDPMIDEAFALNAGGELSEFCAPVPTDSAPESITDLVESDVATLIMSGEYDPITPPSFGDAIAPGFSNGSVVVLPHAGHGASLTDCGIEISLSFFADPSAAVDTSCIADSEQPSWVPGSLEGLEFEPFTVGMLGISGVAPAEWFDQGFGTFIRTDTNLAHQTILLQQGAPLPAEQLLDLFAGQFGGESTPAGSIGDSTGRTWSITDVDTAFSPIRMYSTDVGSLGIVVAVFGTAGDIVDMEANVIPTILDAIEPI